MSNLVKFWIGVVVVVLSLALCADATAQPLRTYGAKVVDCYDGDICRMDIYVGFGLVMMAQGVRLCDIDAAEMTSRAGSQRKSALEARDWLRARLAEAMDVRVQIPQRLGCRASDGRVCEKTGKYGRWLVYIIADGMPLNAEMVRQGLALPHKVTCVK